MGKRIRVICVLSRSIPFLQPPTEHVIFIQKLMVRLHPNQLKSSPPKRTLATYWNVALHSEFWIITLSVIGHNIMVTNRYPLKACWPLAQSMDAQWRGNTNSKLVNLFVRRFFSYCKSMWSVKSFEWDILIKGCSINTLKELKWLQANRWLTDDIVTLLA